MWWIDTLLDVGSAILGADSQHRANRTNIQLQRQNQQWQKEMADTAVQRHAWDIQRAGGNPALAFEKGGQAAVPSIQSARVDPEFRGEPITNITAKRALSAQIDNTKADTRLKEATARKAEVDAQVIEDTQVEKVKSENIRWMEEGEQHRLKTRIMRNMDLKTGADAKRASETVDAMIQTAKQQARAGKLDLDALENIAEVGGIEAGKASPIIKMIIDTIFRAEGK